MDNTTNIPIQPDSFSELEALADLEKISIISTSLPDETTTDYIEKNLGVDLDTSETLEQKISTFRNDQMERLNDYIALSDERLDRPDHFCSLLNGWSYEENHNNTSKEVISSYFRQAERKTTGGVFIRWNGKGIVINPGREFLKNFHRQGHHIRDIDAVIITQDSPEAYRDIRAIYNMNYRLNSAAAELHIIQYYINQNAHQELAPQLKPHFKQERNTIHCLELYLDSPEQETIHLSQSIDLSYFAPVASPIHTIDQNRSVSIDRSLGIVLKLRSEKSTGILGLDGKNTINIGYVSGCGWSPILSQNFNNCDVLLTGFESTSANDYSKIKYPEDHLGYFGTYSLVEEVQPSILVYNEFNGKDGDIRLEVAKKMRQELSYSESQKSVVVPGDTGLYIDLESLKLRCSVSQTFVDPRHIKVIKSKEAFGQLKYLSPGCVL